MNKAHLRLLAHEKFEDAKLLHEVRRYSSSYYLFGYVIEFLLKARISELFIAGTIPDKKLVNDIYVHDLGKLVVLAGLADDLQTFRRKSQLFDHRWSTVTEWSESKRYDIISASQSTSMYEAMTDTREGIYEWLSLRCS